MNILNRKFSKSESELKLLHVNEICSILLDVMYPIKYFRNFF